MKRTFYFIILLLLPVLTAAGQVIDPVHWEFTARKTGENTYDVYATASMDDPWHIYSQYTDEGGPLPTTFDFKEQPGLSFRGKPSESGALIEKYEGVFMVDTRYYAGMVDFIQKVEKHTAKPVGMKGSVTYMACTEEQCLTPQEVEFEVVLD